MLAYLSGLFKLSEHVIGWIDRLDVHRLYLSEEIDQIIHAVSESGVLRKE